MNPDEGLFISSKEEAQWEKLDALTEELSLIGRSLSGNATWLSHWTPNNVLNLSQELSHEGVKLPISPLQEAFSDVLQNASLGVSIAKDNLKRFDQVLAKINKLRSEIDA